MQVFWTLTRREMAAYFVSLTGYLIISAATFIMGFILVYLLGKLQQDSLPMPITVTELFAFTPFVILPLTTPVITMRLFAQEKFSGTFETLMTAPVTDLQVVLAKFCAALFFYLIMWLPLLGCLFVVRYYTHETGAFELGALGGTFLGILLLGGLFIGLGCCASALTRSQMSAAMVSLLFGASLFLLCLLASQPPNQLSWQGKALAYISLLDYMLDFSRGVVDTRPIVLLVSLTLFFLFLTLRIIESRRWK